MKYVDDIELALVENEVVVKQMNFRESICRPCQELYDNGYIGYYKAYDIVNDVKQVYLDEFEQTRIEYNNKQTREDRKIEDYFKKVCESQNDIACEIIIELGDMYF